MLVPTSRRFPMTRSRSIRCCKYMYNMTHIFPLCLCSEKELYTTAWRSIPVMNNSSLGTKTCDGIKTKTHVVNLFTATNKNVKYYTCNNNYYSFKIFSRFWLVKTTCVIHHNQMLFTKFGKNLRHIESMTSKVQPAGNYWTDDVKMTSKEQPAADYWTVDRENLGARVVIYLVSGKPKSVMAKLL